MSQMRLAMWTLAVSAAVTLTLSACATTRRSAVTNNAVARELARLGQEVARLEPKHRHAVSPAASDQVARLEPKHRHAVSPAASDQGDDGPDVVVNRRYAAPGPAPVPRAPDPAAPPPLPVVKLEPLQANPFPDGTEPTIRIGHRGRLAQPAAPRLSSKPFGYDHIDADGDLVDKDGRVVYRAGADTPMNDTGSQAAPTGGNVDLDHASPEMLAAQATAVPHVISKAEEAKLEREEATRQKDDSGDGVTDGTDGTDNEDTLQPGVHRIGAARPDGTVIGDGELPDMHGPSIVVDNPDADMPRGLARPHVARSQRASDDAPPALATTPAWAPTPAVKPTPTSAAKPTPTEPPVPMRPLPPAARAHRAAIVPPPVPVAPAVPAAPVAYEVPKQAPGPQHVIHQRHYKGAKEGDVKRLYAEAMKAFHAGENAKAARLYDRILVDYPDHTLADNALYWLGETAYGRGDWMQALTWFQDVILRYPEGNKLPDALLKSGLCYARLGDTSYAVKVLTEVESLFKGTHVAEIAHERRVALGPGGPGEKSP